MFSPPQPIYPVAGIRAIEALAAPEAQPSLMERAGRAAAEEAVRLTMDRPGTVLIACGPGNNGGDGLVMARRLLQAGRPVMVACAADPERQPPEARAAFQAWRAAGGETTSDFPAPPAGGWSLVVDALFGIGLQRPLEGRYAEWIRALNAQNAPRLALDIPSGLDADTGRVLGTAFHATQTLTFLALKPGLLTFDGPDHAGEVHLARLDVDPTAWVAASGYQISPAHALPWLTPRRHNTHKGSYGEVGMIGGAPGMTGAALLAARAALKLGAGRVFVGLVDEAAPALDDAQPELMLRPPEAVLGQSSVLAIGPGLGTAERARILLGKAIATDTPLLLDADALNLVAQNGALNARVASRRAPSVLTPHPAEAARLLAVDIPTVQANRIAAAQEIAARYRATVVLKGCGSVVATPDGRWFINTSGHPGMASAGMGDVLTGLIASLLAQGWPAEVATLGAVHLHGAAGDRLAREGVGPIGLTAGEVIDAARSLFNGWIAAARGR